MSKIFLFFLIFITLSCNSENINETLKDKNVTFSLKYQKMKYIESIKLQIGFEDVLEDSRCPFGAVCLWEGVAKIKLWLKENNRDTLRIISTISGIIPGQDSLFFK